MLSDRKFSQSKVRTHERHFWALGFGDVSAGECRSGATLSRPRRCRSGLRYPYSYHASTAAEGYYRGYADFLRGLGVYNVDSAIAAGLYQDAYEHWLKNHRLWVESYYAIRDLHDAWAKAHHPPVTAEQAQKLAKMGIPQRLSPKQWDATTKSLAWPAVLKVEDFEKDRLQLNMLFAEHFESPKDAGLGTANYNAIRATVDEMREELKAHIRNPGISPTAYIEARKFLDTLAYEARFATLAQ